MNNKPHPQSHTKPHPNSALEAVRTVLGGNTGDIKAAFAKDEEILDAISQKHNDPTFRNLGVMAGSLKK